ncbi:MAG: ribonuclease D [Gammaproteobacteria bacterium]|nr:ribonuclease D [Gammaproteobacteria bacterium]
MNAQYIDSNAALNKFCTQLEHSSWLAIDSEFIREKTYYPELALIQIANNDHIACIDPYKIDQFSALIELFNNPDIVKIFHSPSQDLELFAHFFSAVPQNIFDTQLAASLLGIGNQIGYADLVNKLCNVQLDKKHTRTDWSRRPLSESELDYALDDVRYLGDIYQQLTQRLIETQRLEWLKADFAALSDINHYQIQWSSLWQKVKGNQKIKGRDLHYADQLCQWREKRAQHKNLPKRWIIKDEDIIDIARLNPQKIEDFKAIRTLKEGFINHQGKQIINLFKQADEIAEEEWPKHEKFKTLSVNQQTKADCLMAICKKLATQNDMAQATLTSKKDIDQLVLGKTSKLNEGWRFEMAGDTCNKFLRGELNIHIDKEGILQLI